MDKRREHFLLSSDWLPEGRILMDFGITNHSLWWFNIAMEHDAWVDDFPIISIAIVHDKLITRG